MLSGISFRIFLTYVTIVFSHFHCGILSHPGVCDPGPAGTTLIRGFAVRRGEEDKKEERSS